MMDWVWRVLFFIWELGIDRVFWFAWDRLAQ